MIGLIRKRDAEQRMARYHLLSLQGRMAVFPSIPAPPKSTQIMPQIIPETAVDLVHEWGRIGSPGTVRAETFADEAAAIEAAHAYLRRKLRKGYT
jgi:predicted DNA-binding WGR domain protein